MKFQDSMTPLRRIAAGLALAVLALPAAMAQEKMQLQLNWFQLADHAPVYLAMKKGYFKEEGIELTVLRGSGSADSAKKIDLGQATTSSSRRARTSRRRRTWSARRSPCRRPIRTACSGRRSPA